MLIVYTDVDIIKQLTATTSIQYKFLFLEHGKRKSKKRITTHSGSTTKVIPSTK